MMPATAEFRAFISTMMIDSGTWGVHLVLDYDTLGERFSVLYILSTKTLQLRAFIVQEDPVLCDVTTFSKRVRCLLP